MYFGLSEDQIFFQKNVSKFLSDHSSLDIIKKIAEGEKLVGYLKKIREDGKLDISLQAVGFKHTIVKNEIAILNALRRNDGVLALHDKSDPDEIKYQLGMSKKAFKSAIGGLFRQKLIVISEEGIKFV